jgi:Tfp pilus assembly major pilin PilA
MPNYDSLSTQIDAVKAEITTSLAASTYTAQDLVFISKALETLGSLLGVNDIVDATADSVALVNNAGTTQVTAVNSAGTTQVAAVNSAGNTKIATITATANDLTINSYMGVLA